MAEKFDGQRIVEEFEEYINQNIEHFEFLVNEIGLSNVNKLSFFIGEGYSSDREQGYYKLGSNRLRYDRANKFADEYLHDALEAIFTEYETYTGLNIGWVRECISSKLLTENYRKKQTNKMYGILVYGLVEHGSSQNNSFEFVSSISGLTKTVIRDSYYELKSGFDKQVYEDIYIQKILDFLDQNKQVVGSFSKNPKFLKSAIALDKYREEIINIKKMRFLVSRLRASVKAI